MRDEVWFFRYFYTSMPLYHGTASVLGVAAALGMGAAVAIGHKFSTSTFWTQVKLSGATVIQYVGETGRYLVTAPKSPDERDHKVRLATGNGMRSDIWLPFKQRFNIPVIGEFLPQQKALLQLPTIKLAILV